ncbi:membrane-bound lytic murein transglycosylase D [Gammaproteobacteria bacterium]
MRKNSFRFLVAGGAALFVALSLVPVFSGADPELPDEAFAQVIAADDPFPHQQELAARVSFWRHVFGVWDRRQVALHDMNNPGLVYEVLTLPDSKTESRSTDRKEFIREHVEDLSQRLHTLEQKVARGNDLDDNEQALLNKFRTLGKVSQLPGAHERIRIQRGIRDKFLEGVEISGRYDAQFRQIFRAHGVPEDLAFLPHVESSFQTGARSSVGAVGIWQFTLSAARTFMKVNAAVDERYDPVLAAEGCARYLAHAYEQLGDWGLAITSYNHGIGGMARASSEFGTDFPKILEEYDGPLFGFDSRNFYVEFLAAREVARNAERYFSEVHRERPLGWEKVALDHSAPIHKVAREYGVGLNELTEINTALTTSAMKGRVALPEGTSIWLPAGTQQRLAARTVDEETPAERPIRVVRAPEPTAARMMVAMAEDSLSTRPKKLDVPTVTHRVLASKDDDDDDEADDSDDNTKRTSRHVSVHSKAETRPKVEKTVARDARTEEKAVSTKKADIASAKTTTVVTKGAQAKGPQAKTVAKTAKAQPSKTAQTKVAQVAKAAPSKGQAATPVKVAATKAASAATAKAAAKPVAKASTPLPSTAKKKVATAAKGTGRHG